MPAAVEADAAGLLRIENCTIFNSIDDGEPSLLITGGYDSVNVEDCRIYAQGAEEGIRLSGGQIQVRIIGNYFPNAEESAMHLTVSGCWYLEVAGNVIFDPGDGGSDTNRAGIYMVGSGSEPIGPTGRNRHIHSNLITGSFLHGIVLEDLEHANVHDNTVERVHGHGILLIDSSQCNIHNNIIQYFSDGATTNTMDAIHLSGDSDVNQVVSNRVTNTQAGTIRLWRYGVNISASTCDDNIVADNVLFPAAGFGTGAYNDAGTGTITARDANGQFT